MMDLAKYLTYNVVTVKYLKLNEFDLALARRLKNPGWAEGIVLLLFNSYYSSIADRP